MKTKMIFAGLLAGALLASPASHALDLVCSTYRSGNFNLQIRDGVGSLVVTSAQGGAAQGSLTAVHGGGELEGRFQVGGALAGQQYLVDLNKDLLNGTTKSGSGALFKGTMTDGAGRVSPKYQDRLNCYVPAATDTFYSCKDPNDAGSTLDVVIDAQGRIGMLDGSSVAAESDFNCLPHSQGGSLFAGGEGPNSWGYRVLGSVSVDTQQFEIETVLDDDSDGMACSYSKMTCVKK